MVVEVEKYVEEDKVICECIEVCNGFENYVFFLKNQVNDEEGMGKKILEEDKEIIFDVVKEIQDWFEENVVIVFIEDFEEQKEKLFGVVYFIISKFYSVGGVGGEDDEFVGYDEF